MLTGSDKLDDNSEYLVKASKITGFCISQIDLSRLNVPFDFYKALEQLKLIFKCETLAIFLEISTEYFVIIAQVRLPR